MRLRHLFVLIGVIVAGALIAACHQSDVPLITPQPGAPCGNAGVPCYEQAANGQIQFTHECCFQGSVCGGISAINVGCPADSCCAEGDDGVDEFAARKPHVVGKKWRVE